MKKETDPPFRKDTKPQSEPQPDTRRQDPQFIRGDATPTKKG